MSNKQSGNKSISFDALANPLTEMGCTNHPSEIHGLLCGQLSAGLRLTEAQWLQQVKELSGDKPLIKTCKESANHLYTTTLEQLESQDYAFPLLLPDQDEELQQRADALGIWCQSFLSGFGEGKQKHPMSADVEEILKDFSEIAQIQSEIDNNEDAERNFMTISEYVRTTTMVVFLEINHQQKAASPTSTTLH